MNMQEGLEFLEAKGKGKNSKFAIFQAKDVYHFTSDSILLANFIQAKKGDKVADFCAGCGVVGFQFLCNNFEISTLTLIELQTELIQLAEKTIEYNHLKNVKVINTSLQEYANENYREKFDIILCNPPYERGGFAKEKYHIAICRKEITICFDEIVQIASKKLKYGGKFVLCHKVERLAEVIYTLHKYGIEPKKLQFIKGKVEEKPYLFLMEGRKGGKIALDVLKDVLNMKKN